MTTKEVAELTGIAMPTVRKYALILKVVYIGEGRRKTYGWKKSDVDRLKKSIGKRGRPPKKDKK
jgi:DNA-binding transcriptional MerR regulator